MSRLQYSTTERLTIKRYATLDAMRGVAAILVAIYHFGLKFGSYAPEGYLAVDLFFVISGFVIALNYTSRLSSGMSTLTFMKLRIVRLYPLYFLGFFIGMLKQIAGLLLKNPLALNRLDFLLATFFGFFMLPMPAVGQNASNKLLYPLNGPSWSLALELSVNILFSVVLFRLSTRFLVIIIALSGLCLMLSVGSPLWFNVGWQWNNLHLGVMRALFSFPLGILIWRYAPLAWCRESWWSIVLIIATSMLFMLFIEDSFRTIYDVSIVFIVFPIIVFSAIILNPPKIALSVFHFLGDISYGLYAIHFSIIGLFPFFIKRYHFSVNAVLVVFVVLIVILAAIANKLYDVPARRKLQSLLMRT